MDAFVVHFGTRRSSMSFMRRPMRSFIRIYAWHMRTEPRLRKGSGSAPRPTPNSQRIGRVSAAGVRLRSEAPLRSDANPDHPQHAPCKGMAKDFEFAVRRRDSGSPGLRVAPPRDILVRVVRFELSLSHVPEALL